VTVYKPGGGRSHDALVGDALRPDLVMVCKLRRAMPNVMMTRFAL
jgi:hypothetical protein